MTTLLPKLSGLPAKAADIEIILDIILQILSVFEAIARIFGIDLGGNG